MTDDLPTPPLPDATDDPGQAVRPGERDLALGDTASEHGAQGGALVLVHHAQFDAYGAHTLDLPHGHRHVVAESVLERAASRGQQDPDRDACVGVDGDVVDHAEIGDRALDLGVENGVEGGTDLGCQLVLVGHGVDPTGTTL